MIKNQYLISFFLLLLSLTCSEGRFLQTASTSNTTVIRPYNQSLPCGECLLGGYIYCVKGPELYFGDSPPTGVCCNSASNCTQSTDAAWNCSSKYSNQVDKFKICPFQRNQCGNSQNLTLDGLGDSECVKLKNLSRGNACLYRVTSQCGLPNFQLNDTTSNVVIQYRMVSTQSISNQDYTNVPANCQPNSNQACFCQALPLNNVTKVAQVICNCTTYSNVTLNQSSCNCQTLRDSVGNTIQQCSCTAPSPVQVLRDQNCKCARANTALYGDSALSCDCGSTALGNPLVSSAILRQEQCSCYNGYDAVKQQPYYDCSCADVKQCQDPTSFVVKKVSTCPSQVNSKDFPCQCVQTTIGSQSFLSCNCTNSEVRMTGSNMRLNNSQCICDPTANGTSWFQSCACCLNDTVQKTYFTPPIQCAGTDLLEACTCANITVNGQMVNTCNCTNPFNNVTVQAAIWQNNCQFPFALTTNQKPGNCCVSYDIQTIQNQPSCVNKSVNESCKCLNISNPLTRTWQLNCSCEHPVSNQTAQKLLMNPTDCYCHPTNNTMKDCNCCASEPVVVAQLQPICINYSEKQNCSCTNMTMNGRVMQNCACTHGTSNVTAPNLAIDFGSCYCNASTTANRFCNCCVSLETQIFQQQPQCQNTTQKQNCSCNGTNGGLACACAHPITNVTVSGLLNSNSACFCNPLMNNSCNCCISFPVQQVQLQPQCAVASLSENCTCSNVSVNGVWVLNCSCVHNVSQVNVTGLMMSQNNCYCNPNNTKACNCCVSQQVVVQQLQPQCLNTMVKQGCQCSNSSGQYACNCTHSTSNVTISNLVYPTNNCYCNDSFLSNKSCNCCVSQSVVFEQMQPNCLSPTERQPCNCSNSTNVFNGLNCSCLHPSNNVSVANVSVSASSCSCNITNLANSTQKACNCCTPYENIRMQLQPKCTNMSLTEKCFCINNGGVNVCNCTHPANNIPAPLNVLPSQCFCDISTSNNKSCNCCVSFEVQVKQFQPICQTQAITESCQCQNVTINNQVVQQCNCTHPFNNYTSSKFLNFNNLLGKLNMSNGCFCDPLSTLMNKACNCCVSADVQTVQLQPVCSGTSQTQNCACANTTSGQKCNCTHPRTNVVYQNISMNQNQCFCSFNDNKVCNCCVSFDVQVIQQQPKCMFWEDKQTCGCSNATSANSSYNCSCANTLNNVQENNLNMTDNTCFCLNSTLGQRPCNCCVSAPTQLKQLQPNCTSTTQTQSCTCVNTTLDNGRTFFTNCSCKNPFNNISVSNLTNLQNQCYCNFTQGNQCNCCVSMEVQIVQLQPQCLVNDQKQVCACANVTVGNSTYMNCSCAHLNNGVIAGNLSMNNSQCYCSSNNTINNNKFCNCCVAFPVQVAQLQPMCSLTSQKQNCSCNNVTRNGLWVIDCSCVNPFNNISAPVNNMNQNQCYCNNTFMGQKYCNCCVSQDVQVIQLQPICTNNSQTQKCSCQNTTAGNSSRYTCDCRHPQNNVTAYTLSMPNSSCYCNQTSCNCCVGFDVQVAQLQPVCDIKEQKQPCQCNNISLGASTYLRCGCNHLVNFVPAIATPDESKCYCNNTMLGNKFCNCCVSEQVQYQQLLPTCSATGFNNENCSCTNTSVGKSNCSCTFAKTNFLFNNMSVNSSSCYCPASSSTNKSCACCVSDTQVAPPQFVCPSTERIDCSCFNQTINSTNYNYVCNCTNKYFFNATSINVNANNQSCYCQNATRGAGQSTNCTCCLSALQLVTKPICSATQQRADSKCATLNSITNSTTTCNSTASPFGWSMIATNFAQNGTSCSCVNTTDPKVQDCECCTNNNVWQSARPICQSNTGPIQSCRCSNVTGPNNSWNYTCNCTGNTYNNLPLPLMNQSLSQPQCGCDVNNSTTNKTCDCCLTQEQEDAHFLVNGTCPSDTSRGNCTCLNSAFQKMTCDCNHTNTLVYKEFSVNQTLCNCLNATSANSNQNCKCCLSTKPLAVSPTCSANGNQQSCECTSIVDQWTNRTVRTCVCTNKTNTTVKTTQVFNSTVQACSCLNVTNGTRNYQQCECCVQNTLQCSADKAKVQNCSCNNITNIFQKTWQWNCSCLRNDTQIRKTFPKDKTDCFCGTTGDCQCCMTPAQEALQIPILTCPANETLETQNCSCQNITTNGRWSWNCSCLRRDTNIKGNFTFNQTLCLCNGTQNCNCCISQPQYITQIPVLYCSATASQQNCQCRNITANNASSPLDCNCTKPENNITKNFTYSQDQCLYNATLQRFNCCVTQTQQATQFPVMNCTTGQRVQACQCGFPYDNLTKSSAPACNCTRQDTGILKQFNFTNGQCLTNQTNSNSYNCCISQTQYETMIPVLQCPANNYQVQNCSCKNTTAGMVDCNCTRPDNLFMKNFALTNSLCLCNTTGCSCCMSPEQVTSQQPRLDCDANFQKQSCSCNNYTNTTTRQTTYNCSCTKIETQVSNVFQFNQTASTCLCNGTNCSCCVSGQQQGSQWPTLKCSATTQQQNCSCKNANVTNAGIKTAGWECSSCDATYQNKQWLLQDLVYTSPDCLCNSTYCQCCVNDKQIESGTEKQCSASQLKTPCSCTNTTNAITKNMNYNCTCNAVTPAFNVNQISFIDTDGSKCLCRNQANCSCCLTPDLLVPTPVTCMAPNSNLPNCTCTQVNNVKVCECKNTTKCFDYFYNNLNMNNNQCGCLNYQSASRSYLNCSCCATQGQVSPSNPAQCVPSMNSTFQQCSCRNVTDQATRLNQTVCNCSYTPLSSSISNLPLVADQCGCENTNNPFKNCSCCVNVWHYRNSILPTCTATNPSTNCTCVAATNGMNNCSCTQKQSTGVVYQAALQMPSTQCGCWNEPGQAALNCSCCVNNFTLTRIPQPTCTVDSIMSYSECSDNLNSTTKIYNKVCNITARPSSILTIQQDLVSVVNATQNCGCINLTSGSRTYQQCQCCAFNQTFLPTAQVCDANSSNQTCECKNIIDPMTGFLSYSCNCTGKVNNAFVSANNIALGSNKCGCVNTTVGTRNYQNCSCCVPISAPTFCQQVSIRNATNFACSCQNVSQSGQTPQLKCDCSAPVNTTTLLFKQSMILPNSQCCCVSQVDPFTRKTSLSCNCTQTAVPTTQPCNCTAVSTSPSLFNCSCSDCNKRNSSSLVLQNRCNCQTSTLATKNCSCSIDFNGICPTVLPFINLDDNSCDASNKPKSLNITASNGTLCGAQYEYLVAVVAAGKDSNLLLNLQSYQLSASYIKYAMASAIIALTFILAY